MSDTTTIGAAEFKARCLDILDQLSSRTLTKVTVTKRGKPVAVLIPPEMGAEPVESLSGCMRGSVIIKEGADPTKSVCDESWDAASGILHR